MPTFIKTGYWDRLQKGYNGWLNLDEFFIGKSTAASAGQIAFFDASGGITGSSSLFWDNINGRLGIGTNAPSYTLEARTNLAGPVEFGLRTANAFSNMAYGTMIANVEFSGWKGGSFGNENAAIQVYYNGDGTNRKGKMHLLVAESTFLGGSNITLSQSTTNNKITIIGTGGNSYNDTIASPSLTTAYAQHANTIINGDGGIPILSIDKQGVSQAVFFSTGNFSIGSTTDDNTNKLQVTGSIKATGIINAAGYEGPANVQLRYENNNSYVRIEDTGSSGNGISFRVNNLSNSFKFSHNNNYSFTLGYAGAGNNMAAWFGNSTALVIANASAQVQIDSTTKGFLPPRMTTAEKTAIATPAAGLMVYDTTLNKMCVYTGAAWQTITSA